MQFLTSSPSGVSIRRPHTVKRIALFLFLMLAFAASGADAFSFFTDSKEGSSQTFNFTVSAISDPERIQPGGGFSLHVKVELAEGWHIYSLEARGEEGESLATEIRLDSTAFLPQGVWKEPPPSIVWDGALERIVKTHEKIVEFSRWHRVRENLRPGPHKISGSIVFRACNNKVCSLPRELPFETRLQVTGGDG